MGLVKRIGKSERVRGFLCWVASVYIRVLWVTGRWTQENRHIPAQYWDQGKPFILTFWHGRLLMMIPAWRSGVPFKMLASHHRDGMMIAHTAGHFGIDHIAGSSTRGGAGALRALVKALKSGCSVGITPDGPRGPRMRASDGVITLAKLSGCPIIPATSSASPRRLLKSWDRFLVPRLFARGLIVWGDPIFIPRDADDEAMEQWRLHLEQVLNAQCDLADARLNEAKVEPA